MKYLAALLLMTSVLGGHAQAKTPPDNQVLAGLRFEAKRHHLRFVVFCVPGYHGEKNTYQADAELASSPEGAIYYEDGARDSWAETGDTAIQAAYALYLDLANNRSPSITADHRPDVTKCNYNHVYDSEHADKIPCGK